MAFASICAKTRYGAAWGYLPASGFFRPVSVQRRFFLFLSVEKMDGSCYHHAEIIVWIGWIRMVKRAGIEDVEVLADLAIQMWTDHILGEMTEDFRRLVRNEDAVCLIEYADGKPIAFAQCQLRHDYVEGTENSPVGYLEGIFVSEGYRKKGYAAELLSECEKWAKEKGCTEFASDCELDNIDSLRFHLALGFEEANRIICFRKDL